MFLDHHSNIYDSKGHIHCWSHSARPVVIAKFMFVI